MQLWEEFRTAYRNIRNAIKLHTLKNSKKEMDTEQSWRHDRRAIKKLQFGFLPVRKNIEYPHNLQFN